MQRHTRRFLELGRHRRAEHHSVDRDRRGERLCAVVLASAWRRAAVRHPDDGRLHSGAGDGVSAGARAGCGKSVQLFAGHCADPHHLRHAGDDAPVPQLLRGAADGAVQGGPHRRRWFLAHLPAADAADVDAGDRGRGHHAGHGHLERLPAWPGVRGFRASADDGPAEQHHQHHHRRAPVQRQHGCDHPDVGRAAGSLFHFRPLVRARHRLWRG
ncbi:hypothetical protein Jab_2c02930 [Janthinobacterium sp. HH01]|nr:hypothetical protein Jab_2c02930 [Janthinobacterium sp. HH01]